MIRYTEDWFLYGNPNAVGSASKLPFSPDMLAVKDHNGYRTSNRQDRDQVYHEFHGQNMTKDMRKIIEVNGPNLEAQWTFQDSMLSQIYIKLYQETKNPDFLKHSWFHLSRALAFVTGENQISVEGGAMKSFRAPEAWIPVRLSHHGQLFTVYLASPNSPLNWATAELVTALQGFVEAKRMQETGK